MDVESGGPRLDRPEVALASPRATPAPAAGGSAPDVGTGPLPYHPGLDGIRAIAALLVVGLHAAVPGFANGWIGVDIFFTLSGFLITSILLKDIHRHGRPRYRRFYVRRALRLLPAYFAVVVVAVVGDFLVDVGGTLKGALFSAVYLANWAAAGGAGLGSLGHMWSLSIEEQFYFVWPVLLLLVIRGAAARGRSAVGILLAMVVATYLVTVLLLLVGVPDVVIWNATPARSVQLLAGAVLAVGLAGVRRLAGPGLSAAGVVGLAVLLGHLLLPTLADDTAIVVTWPVVALCTCAVIASVVVGGGGPTRLLSVAPMVAIGKVSYGLYLWHYVILTSLDAAYGLDSWGPRVLGLALTAAVVPASYFCIERPFLRRKDRVS